MNKKYLSNNWIKRLINRYINIDKVIVFDWETTGLQPYHGDRGFAFSLCEENFENSVYRLDTFPQNIRVLDDIIQDPDIAIVAHNFKFDFSFCQVHKLKIPARKVIHCTIIMSQLLRNTAPSHALDYLSWELAGIPRNLDAKVKKLAEKLGGYQNVPHHLMTKYQRWDAIRTMMLFKTFWKHILKNKKLLKLYIYEMQNQLVTQHYEEFGIEVDFVETSRLIFDLNEKAIVAEKEFHTLAEDPTINIASDKQIGDYLFNKLNLPIIKYTEKSDEENLVPSTDKDTIFKLQEKHNLPILDKLLAHRSYAKGVSILKGYLEKRDENRRIHTEIMTNSAQTGRKKSSNPNLMNVAKEKAFSNPYPIPARGCFISGKDGRLYFIDYKGLQMRLMIGVSGEKELMDIVNNDGDTHYPTMQCFLGYDEVEELRETNPDEFDTVRGVFKNVGFSMAFGAQLPVIGAYLKKPVSAVSGGYFAYKNRFPRLTGLYQRFYNEARLKGYVNTDYGRILCVNSPHMSLNYAIQHLESVILKRSEVRIDKYLREVWDDKIRQALSVHDEVILYAPNFYVNHDKKFIPDIQKIMVNFPELPVKLGTDVEISDTNWKDSKKWK